jgi:predicted CopG family antitoxin
MQNKKGTIIVEINKIKESIEYSNKIVQNIQDELNNKINNNNICVVTTGSYARGEASDESDMDYFVIVKNGIHDLSYDEKEIIINTINKYVSKDSGDSGTFGDNAIELLENMLKNIGGSSDTNIKITRRMLFLLESMPLYNGTIYDDVMDRLLNIYVKNIKKEQIARFLLNDIIRYYRTITVDFEFKTSEVGKSWGLRNIKLTYSRKLIYFSGILCVAKTMDLEKDEKIDLLKEMFNVTPLDRVEKIVNNSKDKEGFFKSYNNFLKEISSADTRKSLNSILTMEDERSDEYIKLKDESKAFSQIIIQLIKETFEQSHRIHEAIVL